MASSYVHTLRLFSRDIRLYLISFALFAFTIFGGIYTVLLNLYLLRLGYGPEFIGLVNAVGLLALALFFLPAGAITRRWGLRRAMIAGLASRRASGGWAVSQHRIIRLSRRACSRKRRTGWKQW
jgi:MFS family permease